MNLLAEADAPLGRKLAVFAVVFVLTTVLTVLHDGQVEAPVGLSRRPLRRAAAGSAEAARAGGRLAARGGLKAARLAAANGGRFSPGRLALAGLVSLAVAMGIGRFAFTPLLPMMLSDGVVDLAGASWLASANYFGYVLGAVLCVVQPAIWQRLGLAPFRAAAWVRGGLTATVLLTLGMALPLPAAWPTLRFAAGVASAIVFVFTSGWCLARLAERGAPALGGLIYVGPGIGIVASGLLASGLVALDRPGGQWLAAVRRPGRAARGLHLAGLRCGGGAGGCAARCGNPCGASRQRGTRRAADLAGRTRPADRGVRAGRLRLHHHRHLPAGDRAPGAGRLGLARLLLAACSASAASSVRCFRPPARTGRPAPAARRLLPDAGARHRDRPVEPEPRRLCRRQPAARPAVHRDSPSSRCRRCAGCGRCVPPRRWAC